MPEHNMLEHNILEHKMPEHKMLEYNILEHKMPEHTVTEVTKDFTLHHALPSLVLSSRCFVRCRFRGATDNGVLCHAMRCRGT